MSVVHAFFLNAHRLGEAGLTGRVGLSVEPHSGGGQYGIGITVAAFRIAGVQRVGQSGYHSQCTVAGSGVGGPVIDKRCHAQVDSHSWVVGLAINQRKVIHQQPEGLQQVTLCQRIEFGALQGRYHLAETTGSSVQTKPG